MALSRLFTQATVVLVALAHLSEHCHAFSTVAGVANSIGTGRQSPLPPLQSATSSVDETGTNAPSTEMKESSEIKPQSHYDSIISGGGPAGLLTAIMLSQKLGPDHKIALCERRPALPPQPDDATVWNDIARFYVLGIGHRGQSALREFGVMDDFIKASVEVNGRRDWQPGQTAVEDGRITPARKNVVSRILPRDKLVGVLYHHLVENYVVAKNANIDLLYGYEVTPLDFGLDSDDKSGSDGSSSVSVMISKCEQGETEDSEPLCNVEDDSFRATTNFLIGADGSARTVANAMECADADRRAKLHPLRRLFAKRPFQVTRFEDDNPKVYKSVPIKLPADWPADLNYSARSRGNRITLEALPSDDQGNLCALLLMKPDDDLAQANVEPAVLRAFFDAEFPQFGALISDEELALVAKKPASTLPAFRFAGPRLNMGQRTLVLGDAAHTVKPYYGLGANSAMEDVQMLSDALDDAAAATTDAYLANVTAAAVVPRAVELFSKRRSGDAEALVVMSRSMDRPGKRFFLNFLLPIILDGIFHKFAPAIFGPNMFGMFQRQDLGFRQIQRKKRLDRALQAICIGSLLTGAGFGVKAIIGLLSRVTGKSRPVVTLSMAATVAGAALLRKMVDSSRGKEDAEQ